MDRWKIYEELTQASGAPGFENDVREIMKTRLDEYADEVVYDRLGSIFGVKRGLGSGPKIMVAGHLDEVAFLITKITKEGFLRFQTIGGWWSQVLLDQRVEITTRMGEKIQGVIGSIPPHLLTEEKRKTLVQTHQMFIDIGAEDSNQVKEWGIEVGNVAVPVSPYTPLKNPNRILSKAWDNRFGCGVSIRLLQDLRKEKVPSDVFCGATVQEEVGLRGAQTAAEMIRPDLFFAVDSGPAGDTPGVSEGFGQLGKGVLIRIYDRSLITSPAMRDFLLDTAETEKIPYQYFVSQGGTDAGRVHTTGIGVPSAAIGVCARYIHSHVSIIDKEDIEATEHFLLALIKRIDRTVLSTILTTPS